MHDLHDSETVIRVVIAHEGEPAFIRHATEDQPICAERFQLPIKVTIRSDDGVLDEELDHRLNAIAAADLLAQSAVNDEERERDPDVVATEEFVRELRIAAEANREPGRISEPQNGPSVADQIERWSDEPPPGSSLEERITHYTSRLDSLRLVYSDRHPTVVVEMRRLDELKAERAETGQGETE